ncbi:MAG TPA: cytochrome c1 [Burkholderiales bacterium]|nr:cytochrome c1 [Burkholderiales bacterium]
MRNLIVVFLLAPLCGWAAEAGYRLDDSPHDPFDLISLQAGARTYVNYCLGCHGLEFMRYSKLTELGLTEAQIKDYLMFSADKVGEPIRTVMPRKESKSWFGVAPPDLSLAARARSADWLYTYLRAFYRDPKTVTGWNNAVFENVAMPHALWTLQGERAYDRESRKWTEIAKGIQSPPEYDATVRDLVNFLAYVGEPAATQRKVIGIVALFVLAILFVFTYLLKKEYWKDVK